MTKKKNDEINIGINQSDREKIAEGLAQLLADTFVLYVKTHGFHWNVEGPQFVQLHKLFEEQYNELWSAVDVIAERIRALGVRAPGCCGDMIAASSLDDDSDADAPDAASMIAILKDGHEAAVGTALDLVEMVEKAKDQPTLDLINQRMAAHEKAAWMLRSLLA